MCKISVLVPIYNVEKYLEHCLTSLSAQDMDDIEIICVNDGSTDNSAEIAHKFESDDARFRVIDKENSGYGNTMNLGLSLANGEYVGIVESDDFIEPDMFSYLYETATMNNADVVKSAFWVHTNGYDAFNDVISEDLYEKVISADSNLEVFEGNPSIWSNLYRREFLEKNDIIFFDSPGASFQDIAWRVKIFAKAKRAVFVKKAFYHYRRDNMNASVRSDGKLFCVCDEYDEAEHFLRNDSHWEDRYRYLLPFLRWGHYIWNCFYRWLNMESRWKFYKHMLEEMLGYKERGLLNQKFWRSEQWSNLQNMFIDSGKFFFDQCLPFWRKPIMLNGIFAVLETAPKLAIYGAGKVGNDALLALRLYGRQPECFMVSDVSCNDKYVHGVPVRGVDEFLDKTEDYVILIATALKSQPKIVESLLNKGFYNIVPFLPEIRQVLCV